jgi:DNA-binding transcriptional MerR regulator
VLYARSVSETYSFGELVRAAETTTRTVRYYLERRVLPRAVLHGMHTTYTEEHLLTLKAIRRLRTLERLPLDAIGKRLAGLSPEALRALAEPAAEGPRGVLTVAVPPALGSAPVTQANPERTFAAPSDVASGALPRGSGGQAWERIELLPGLELHVKSEAGALVQRLAREIREHYGVAGGSPA